MNLLPFLGTDDGGLLGMNLPFRRSHVALLEVLQPLQAELDKDLRRILELEEANTETSRFGNNGVFKLCFCLVDSWVFCFGTSVILRVARVSARTFGAVLRVFACLCLNV